ncbi:hypothetical protein [Clostridium sp. KNHs214]|uniref:hypothetical protein n=1 Tax=Clostridium sp. KNHs214 TaxID=1540257 RepID=UPI0005555AB4|nr:hypothetical protein [Clostridium sp. KNHs214]
MTQLKFYEVDKNYLNFLQKSELKHRGFTKVPNHNYANNEEICDVYIREDDIQDWHSDGNEIILFFEDDNNISISDMTVY